MEDIQVPSGDPTSEQLAALEVRCKNALAQLKAEDSEVKLPIIVEFSGSPKSGKSSIIGIISHFFKRMGIDVATPAEGASIRTPAGLRDDWLSFNAWSGCYALQHILIDCSVDAPHAVVILDRGLFDVAGWMEFLCTSQQRITEADRDAITSFFGLELWMRRENVVFLFTADYPTSLKRENHSKLTQAGGSVMNAETLAGLRQAYADAADRLGDRHVKVFHVDTSEKVGSLLSFRQVAFVVADKIVGIIEELGAQMLLVTETVAFEGFNRNSDTLRKTISDILRGGIPLFFDREHAEKSQKLQQIVPYGILENTEGRYFFARRRADARRPELRSKGTLLVGGHAEQRDWDTKQPATIFERCLRRELDEELIGIKILDIEPLGFISDSRNAMGSHHLAFIHKVKIGGRTAIRRQAIDKEFGRESVSWRTGEEIGKSILDLDPWSQLVAAAMFNIEIPLAQEQLFSSTT